MQVPATASTKFRVGPFTIDVAGRDLRKAGSKIALQEKPFQLLAILLEKPGEIVTREEISQRLWSADTFVDFEHNINTAVGKLREALEDDPERPRFIETLARRGYRWIARVSEIADGKFRERLFVLPFQNLSGREKDFFSCGLTEQTVMQLERLCRQIDVVAPASVRNYEDGKPAAEICAEFGVDYLLVGGVQKADGHVHVTARLIRATDQSCIWAEGYTRKAKRMLTVQDELAAQIAREIFVIFPCSQEFYGGG